jgi:hypothetical protein
MLTKMVSLFLRIQSNLSRAVNKTVHTKIMKMRTRVKITKNDVKFPSAMNESYWFFERHFLFSIKIIILEILFFSFLSRH